jgi:protein subunit release factor A
MKTEFDPSDDVGVVQAIIERQADEIKSLHDQLAHEKELSKSFNDAWLKVSDQLAAKETKLNVTNKLKLCAYNEIKRLKEENQQLREALNEVLLIAKSAPVDYINSTKSKHDSVLNKAKSLIL